MSFSGQVACAKALLRSSYVRSDRPTDLDLPTGLYRVVRLVCAIRKGRLNGVGIVLRAVLTNGCRAETLVGGGIAIVALPLETVCMVSGT